jgi:serine phosphatase RsbU (regulator of sigma subunit)
MWSKRDGVSREFVQNGLFLGPFAAATYTSVQIPLAAGDRLLLYTDGILEFKNREEEEFGGDRLKQFLDANHHLSADQFVQTLITKLWSWDEQPAALAQLDDITLLAIDVITH